MQTPYTSPHSELTAKALETLKELDADSKWAPYSDLNGVKIWTQPPPDNVAMPMTKGHTTIEGVQPFDVFSVVAFPAGRQVWDERFDGITSLESYGPRAVKFQSTQKGTFPVAGREFVGVQNWALVDGTYYLVQYSIEDSSVPVLSGKVRGHIHIAGWIIAPASDNTVSVTYITRVDVKGSVPSAILRLVVSGTPGCVGTVKKYIANNGIPPQHIAVNPRGGLRTLEETYSATAGYTVSLAAKEGAEKDDSFYFVLSNVTWADGAKIAVSGSTGSVELALAEEGDPVVPSSGRAFVVKPTGVAGTVNIKITKSSGGAITLP
ncbi:hypothetical protein BJ742DRAFT_798626 [Cladochytrium replicatum]|nr:hypothetical protein BJ742DRAFT_798626 [Cladochytrium replicatum]